MLNNIFTGNPLDANRYSVSGLIVMALGVALFAAAKKLSKDDEKRYYLLKFGGLIVTMIGAVIAVRLFG